MNYSVKVKREELPQDTAVRELKNCSFVKTVLMMIVVLYHSIVFWGGLWFTKDPAVPSAVLKYLAEWFNSFHIYGFTLVSGFIFYQMKYKKGKYGRFLPFISKKACRLLIPYVFVCAVWAIPAAVYFLDYSVDDTVKYFVLGTAPGQLWFILMLFGVFAVTWWLSDFFVGHDLAGAASALGFYCVGFVGGKLIPNYFQIFTVCNYIIFFWLGMKLSQYELKILRKIPFWVWLIADGGIFALTLALPDKKGAVFTVLEFGIDLVLHLTGALAAFFTLQKLADATKWSQSRVFSFISRRSMTVYLFHQQIIYISITLLNGVVSPFLNAGINFIAAFGVSLALASVLMIWKPTRFLIGEK